MFPAPTIRPFNPEEITGRMSISIAFLEYVDVEAERREDTKVVLLFAGA